MKNEDNRPDPDKLLASIHQEENNKMRGKLKIFFGMCPGVGKTYSMLQAARSDISKGIDVIIGYVESHNRPETNILLEGIEIIPREVIDYKGKLVEEMDLDAIIKRHPYLVLVDELAHTNAGGSRHRKRYQDVIELLDNGINVYTTVNIQHLESRNDTVAEITGIIVKETIPDEIFELADDIELVDITPTALLDRLAEGKIYAATQSKNAMQNFFRKGNITALREMSLRLVADRVDKQLKSYMQEKQITGPWKSGLHFLVLIGPSKSSAKLIRWAKNLSYTMGAGLIALHVENTQVLSEKAQEQLSANIDLARNFGAEVIIASGQDVVSTALDVARKENVSHIVIGKSGKQSFFSRLLRKDDFVNRLLKESGDIDIYVIESGLEAKQYKKKLISYPDFSSTYDKYILAILAVLTTAGLCLPFSNDIGYQSVSFLLLFVILLLSFFVRLGPIMVAAAISAVVWNFLFIPPQFTIKITKPEDLLTFIMFFLMALVTGTLTSRVLKQERLTRKREEKTNALYHLTSQLNSSETIEQILNIATDDIKKYFKVDPVFILQDGTEKLERPDFNKLKITENEYSIAQWVYKHSKKAGRYTNTLSSSVYTFYPLKSSRTKPGVIIIKNDKKFNAENELFWETFLSQIASSLEYCFYAEASKLANLLDESDKLYKTIFNSISHEFRIPVATIMGAADTLLTDNYPEEVKRELYSEIFSASGRLNRLIENLLNISRLESGKIAPHIDWCDMTDLFNETVAMLKDDLKEFKVDIVVPESMPLVKLDFGLMQQAMHNLVYNSCKYAKPNTTIRLKSFYDDGYLIIQEMDRGLGFPPESLPFAFNKFYRANSNITGGLGIGLSITKGFVEAHNGTISVENRQNGGSRFTIKIPTVVLYKQIESM